MIPLTRPTLPPLGKCYQKIEQIFASGMLTNGRYVAKFEEACQSFLQVKYAVAVSSGTAALTLALKALELTSGEVILPSFTFTSTGHAILWCGLTPVFADINPKTFTLDPVQVEKKITKRTVAIMATHVFGNPCHVTKLHNIAKRYKLKLIYDAAHAFGSEVEGRSVACYGDISCFSFTPTKILTTGEGGLVTTNNKNIAHRLRLGRNNGDSFDRTEEFLGLSARLGEIPAAIGLEGMKYISSNINRRQRLVNVYRAHLQSIPGISFQDIASNARSVFKDMAIVVNRQLYGRSRDELLRELKRSNIECKVYFYPALHNKVVYRSMKDRVPITNKLEASIISLPLYSHMTAAQAKVVSSVIARFARASTKK